jgi:hypothetical protein
MTKSVMWVLALTGCFKVVPPPVKVEAVASADAFPYDLYDSAFSERVVDGLIDYATIRDERGRALDVYLGHIAASSPVSTPELFPSDDHELAFYLNAYNALAVQGVIDRPDITTVLDIKVDYFYSTRYRIGGEKVSLYTLENGIIRKGYNDPRIHFFLNCQSMSCPPFPAQAIRPASLDATLDAVTAAFVKDPAHVELQPDGSVAVSSIFQWYAEDFGGESGVRPFIHRYNPDVPAEGAVTYKTYDWTLIAQPGRGPGG